MSARRLKALRMRFGTCLTRRASFAIDLQRLAWPISAGVSQVSYQALMVRFGIRAFEDVERVFVFQALAISCSAAAAKKAERLCPR